MARNWGFDKRGCDLMDVGDISNKVRRNGSWLRSKYLSLVGTNLGF